MARRMFWFAMLAVVCLVSIASLEVARFPGELFVAPGARDVRVTEQGNNRWTLTYLAPGAHFGWQTAVARNLERAGWTPADPANPYAPRRNFVRTRWLVLGYLLERADFYGEPNKAVVRVWRQVYLVWPRVPGLQRSGIMPGHATR